MTVASPAVETLPHALEAGLDRIDALAARRFGDWNVPGLAYGIVVDGRLVHANAMGTLRVGESATPDARSVFRIASMTKSFTAATVLALRDEGRLRLDDEAAAYVPELASLSYPTADSPRITVRHLLTMTAGLPTDDPWGDRQQGLDLDAFRRLVAGGLGFAWVPGTRFEYSNTGYGVLGRLITNVAGREYREVVRERFLEPLGMASTGYLEEEADPDRLARGYLWRDGEFVEEPMDGYGALASMGGLFTTVEDLARWVAFFLDSTPRDDPERGPLSRASRREMQQPMVPSDLRVMHAAADAPPEVEGIHYGFGLFTIDDVRFGRTIGHGGGYPGFGSHMRWHPASGLGIVALTNHRYGPAGPLAREMMLDLLAAGSVPSRRTAPSPATEGMRESVEALLAAWDDARAADLFAMNIELDEPVALRRAAIDAIRERHGTLRPDPAAPTESLTPLHHAWWLTGERGGRVKVEILLSPELPPRLQALNLTSVPEPAQVLRRAAEQIVAALQRVEEGRPVTVDWPAALRVGADVDLAAVVRAMRAVEARYAPLSLGDAIAGDGAGKVTYRLVSERGIVELSLAHDAGADCLDAVSLVPARVTPPELG
jgi:CubicO group peptidase (beta-lactamase class C family)